MYYRSTDIDEYGREEDGGHMTLLDNLHDGALI